MSISPTLHGPDELARYLDPQIFPANRDDLISAAIAAGAPDEVLEMLGAVDPQEIFTFQRLIQALGER